MEHHLDLIQSIKPLSIIYIFWIFTRIFGLDGIDMHRVCVKLPPLLLDKYNVILGEYIFDIFLWAILDFRKYF